MPARVTYTPATTTSPCTEGIGAQTEEPFCPSATEKALLTGYLGPTSFVATFENDREFVSNPSDVLRHDGAEGLASLPGLSPYWVHQAGEVLDCLKDVATVAQLVEEYYNISQAAVIPAPLVLNPLLRVKAVVEQARGFPRDQVLASTATPLQIPSTIEASQLYDLFTGPKLRLEILGVIYAIAGRASMFSLARDRLPSSNWFAVREKFARRMMVASDLILQICRILTPVNDLTIWLMYENLLLASVVHGDSSEYPGSGREQMLISQGSGVWHRLGDLSSHMFELGIHRDPQQLSDLPVFILESRRRIFAAAFQFDKSMATFLGRPPRISWRHSDCSLPLDLSDDAVVGSPSEFELASTSIDSQGWNVQKPIQRASWIRVRFLISTFREEILELSLQRPTRDTVDQLRWAHITLHRSAYRVLTVDRNISFRCHQAWDSLPGHLRYTPDCWDRGLSIDVCLMLSVSYLAYLYNDFLIQRLLVQQDLEAQAALLDVSATILSTVLSYGIQREHVIDIKRDFIWTVRTRPFLSLLPK